MRIGLFTALFLLFLGLKLSGNIDWSWWWVTAPLWVIPLVVFIAWVVFVIVAATYEVMK